VLRWTAAWLVLALALPCARVEAQDRQHPLLGERALGMGGAVSGSPRGPTAAFYNPAGLTAESRTALGASLSLRTFRSYGIANGYQSIVGVEDLDDTNLDSSSVFLGGLVAFGGRNELGQREHAIAAGTLVRSAIDRAFTDSAANVELDRASTLDVTEERSDRWFYLGYSARPSTTLSLGITAAVSVRSERYEEAFTEGEGLDDGMDERLTTRDVTIDLDTIHLLFRAGVTFRFTDWLQAGLVFQAPGIPLSSSGNGVFTRLSVDVPESTLYREELSLSDASIPAPWELRSGLYARVSSGFGLGLDIGLIGPVGGENDPWLALGRPVPRDQDRPAATYYASERISDVGLEVSLGAEIEVFDEVPIRGGVFYELNGNHAVDAPRPTYPLDSVDRIGTTLSVGVHDDHYDFTLGASYAYGWGTGARPNPGAGPAYVPTTVESHEITLVLSGVTGAAAELALEAYRMVSEPGEPELDDETLLERLPMPPAPLDDDELLERLPMPPRAE